jgi:proteasome lid subunit RPN8/RPN11
MDTRVADTPTPWNPRECPFSIEYLPKVLDDIRLAVVDAFFSLPRGGAEIGGILLGRHERGRVIITDSVALECEHAFGPSFTLSKPDLARLEELLATARNNPSTVPVGWYHSHTRSEIFLSDVDQEIHKRFFPEPWQVALVLKPHTFQPTRAGFFFREKDGSIHSTGSYQEFLIEPLPMHPVPSQGAPATAQAAPFIAPEGPVVDLRPEPPSPPAAVAPEPEPVREAAPELKPPAFLEPPPPARSWKWVGFLAMALGAGLAVGLFQTRDRWLPPAGAGSRAAAPPAPVTLTTIDHQGQLQISWDGSAPEIVRSSGGSLTVRDNGETQSIALDAAHLQTGSFTYARQGDHVDLVLTVNQPDGSKLVQAATYLGKAPPQQVAAPAADAQNELAAENERLKAEVARQVERVRRLEKALEDLRIARQRELQRKRLENQAPDIGKQ